MNSVRSLLTIRRFCAVSSLALVAGMLSSCALLDVRIPVRTAFPAGMNGRLTSAAVSHSGGECAKRLANDLSSLLISRGVRVVRSGPGHSGRYPGAAFVVTIEETVCATDGEGPGLGATEQTTKVSQTPPFVEYPALPAHSSAVPDNGFTLEATVQVMDVSTGCMAGRLELFRSPYVEGGGWDGNLMTGGRSAEHVAFAGARGDLERFLFPWREDFRLSGYESVSCGSMGAGASRDLAGRIAEVESCRDTAGSRTDGRLSAALYNLGLAQLQRNALGAAIAAFEEAVALSPRSAKYRDALVLSWRIRFLEGVVVPPGTMESPDKSR